MRTMMCVLHLTLLCVTGALVSAPSSEAGQTENPAKDVSDIASSMGQETVMSDSPTSESAIPLDLQKRIDVVVGQYGGVKEIDFLGTSDVLSSQTSGVRRFVTVSIGGQEKEFTFVKGVLESVPFLDATGDGISVRFYENGRVNEVKEYAHNSLKRVVKYHKNGRIASIIHFKDGMLFGTATRWDEGGHLIETKEYREPTPLLIDKTPGGRIFPDRATSPSK